MAAPTRKKNCDLASCGKKDPKHNKFSKMKRQRNMKKLKEHGTNLQDKTNEEEIGSLP